MSWIKIAVAAGKYLSLLLAGYEVNDVVHGLVNKNSNADDPNKWALVVAKFEDALKIKEENRQNFEEETKYVIWAIFGLVIAALLISVGTNWIRSIRKKAQKDLKRDLQV